MTAIGKPLTRADGRLKVTGRARYSAEFHLPGLCHAALVESAVGSGRVRAIDTTLAQSVPGVIAVLTHRNAPQLKPAPDKLGESKIQGESGLGESTWPLQSDRLYFAGQPVALVVAETLEQARHAVALVKVTYDAELPRLGLHDAPAFKPETFAGGKEETLQVTRGTPDAAFQAAPVKLVRSYSVAIEHHNPIELIATIAHWEAGRVTLYDTSRNLDGVQQVVAHAWGMPREKVRAVCPFIGGAFGSKGFLWAPAILTTMAAWQVNRPVKLELRRQEMFHNAGMRPRNEQTLKVGAEKDGKLIALLHETRAHTSPISGYPEPCGRLTKTLYECRHLSVTHEIARLNLPSACPMRAPGESVGTSALEAVMDELAYELNLDPVELRLRNYAERDPENGKPWSSKNLRECYRQGAEKFGWARRNPKPGQTREGRYLIGEGMATTMYQARRRPASARATLYADGRAIVQSAAHDQGNGAYTVLRQVSADALGVGYEQTVFELGDTDFPDAPPAGGSVTTASVGAAIYACARNMKAELLKLAQRDPASVLHGLSTDETDAGDGYLWARADPARRLRHADILKAAGRDSLTVQGDAAPDEEQPHSVYSFGAVFCRVRVDPELGTVRVAHLTAVYDVGRVLNPKTAHSQFMGGLLMGLGQALLEETLYDGRTARAVIRDLNEYHVATFADTPVFDVLFLDIPDPYHDPMGGRNLGEIGIVGTAAAVANAIYHATGKRVRDLPITPDKLL